MINAKEASELSKKSIDRQSLSFCERVTLWFMKRCCYSDIKYNAKLGRTACRYKIRIYNIKSAELQAEAMVTHLKSLGYQAACYGEEGVNIPNLAGGCCRVRLAKVIDISWETS